METLLPAQNGIHIQDALQVPVTEVFTVGICATGNPPHLLELVDSITAEPLPQGLSLGRIVIAGSACSPETLSVVRRAADKDPRIKIIEENRRSGKANAINTIIRDSLGEYLVLVNADALPVIGSLSKLLEAIRSEDATGMVSGRPVISSGRGVTSLVLELMWETHNSFSSRLDRLRLSNHGTDEMMVARSVVLDELPGEIVNDGAFIAGRAAVKGYSVRFLRDAPVLVEVPARMIDVVRQRRRIMYGHMQIWRLLGQAPRTAEVMLLFTPRRGLSTFARVLGSRPRLLLALPFAAVGELISLVGCLTDAWGHEPRHVVWRRFESRPQSVQHR